MSTSPYKKTSGQLARKRERELLESHLLYSQALCDVLKDQVNWHHYGIYKMGLSRLGDIGGGLVILVQQIRQDRFVHCYRLEEFLKTSGQADLVPLKAIARKAAAG